MSLKLFDFSPLYTIIPHFKLKDKLKELVMLCFLKKNGQRRYNYLVLWRRDKSYFVNNHSDSNKQKISNSDNIKMLDFLIDNIFVTFGGRVFQRTIGISMGTNCALFLSTCFCIIMRLTSYKNL